VGHWELWHTIKVKDLNALAAEVLNSPETLGTLPRPVLVDLRRRLAHLVADADALLVSTPAAVPESAPKVLTIDEACLMLRCSRDSLYRKHRRLRLGFIDPLDSRLKFHEAQLRAHLMRQTRLSA
jgi:hypothetical protein